ncbi:glycosyltransferase SypQ [Vibrio ponticus]|nr:glycosyltransferase SypQ [Vibrio ponticus]
MLEPILVSMFCFSAALIIYHHLGYPLLLKFASNKASKVVDRQANRAYQANPDDKLRPSVTIVVPAHNEQNWIAQKIRNLACIDYPKNKFKVIIACDGCADDTAEIAEATIQEAICCETHFEIIKFNSNRGKVALINHIMTAVDSDITALSDVSALISIDALLLAEQRFSDPKVGVVNSQYHILNTNNQGERDYWRYQTMLQQGEATSALTSVLMARSISFAPTYLSR